MKTKLISLTLILTLILSIFPSLPVFAENEKTSEILSSPREIHIKDIDDFTEFSKNCGLDSYSKNLTVYLDCDLSLSDSSFEPIPLFFGTFLGQNHRIEAFNLQGKGSNIGLFRYICQGAKVSDLNVSGFIHLSGTASSVGMIAGQNSGKISNCKVSGTVIAQTNTGGVVGINEKEGTLSNCSSSATVSGSHRSGGIAGSNNGILESCINEGDVNTTITKQEENPDIAIDISGITGDTGAVELLDISDSGGIAGINTGAIRYCSNMGTVGYIHVGYNTGGIVGRQSGIIKGCANSGEILGRKDVGGIAGQFEPHITLEFNGSNNEQLREQLMGLNSQLKELSSQIGSAANNALLSAGEINAAMDAIEDALKYHKDESEEDIDKIIEDIHAAFQDVSTDSGVIIDAFNAFNSSANTQLQIIADELENISDILSGSVENLDSYLGEIQAQSDIIRDSLHNIGNYVESLKTFVQNVKDTLNNNELSFKEKREKINELLTNYRQDVKDFSLKSEVQKIGSASLEIGKQLKLILENISDNPDIKNSIDAILAAQKTLEDEAYGFIDSITNAFDNLNSHISSLENSLYGYIGNASDRLDKTFDELYKQLQIINTGVSGLVNAGVNGTAQIGGTASNIMGIFGDLGTTVADSLAGPTYKVEDISEQMVENEEPGQICTSENRGSVKADLNVGGIVGIMALEAGNDPEEDYALNENLWGSTTALFRAALIDNFNKGKVDSKTDCAGGAVGRCDLGTIFKCQNTGNIESQKGSYCGGIVGKSASSVVNCDSYCRIKGTNQLGGIAGSAGNIRDCKSLCDISGEGEEHGAIAGIATGKLENNVFVSRGLNGIDDLSFNNQTTPMTYEEFIKLPNISPIYKDIKIEFMLDGKLISTLDAKYGGSINEEDIPKIPFRKDSFGTWEDFEKEDIFGSMVVEGKYHPWINTITSGGRIPTLLVEGDFSDSTTLEFEELSKIPANASSEKVISAYKYKVTDELLNLPDSLTFRLRCEDPIHSHPAILKDGELIKLDSKTDASCLLFKAPSEATVLVIKDHSLLWLYIAGGIILLVIIVFIIRLKITRKKAKH